jgi:hypothetical protein
VKNFRSLRGLSSAERVENLERVVSCSKELMLLLPEGLLLLSDDEQKKLWGELRPHIFFDPERDNIPTLHHIYVLDKSETGVSIKPYMPAPNCYTVINGPNMAAQLLAEGRATQFEVIADDGIPRTVWSIKHAEIEGGQLILGFVEIELKLNSDFLAVSDCSLSARTRSDPIRTLMMRYLDRTKGEGDLRGCIEFLLSDPEVQEGSEGEILWTSYSGKPQTAKRKTMQNRFYECKREWMSANL